MAELIMAESTPAGAGRRAPGRQARLSRDKIIAQALALLEERAVEELTMTRIAERLGTTTMALYKYFPNRDALLGALADHIFALFDPAMPAAGAWQEQLLAWLLALQRHLERYPAMLKVAGWEGRLSGAWIRVLAPAAQVLEQCGLSGERLAFVLVWFTSSAIGLMRTELESSAYRQSYSLSALDQLSPREQQIFMQLLPHLPNTDRGEVTAFGLQQLVLALERLLAEERRE
jgi:AcrR family transcriptional regulator